MEQKTDTLERVIIKFAGDSGDGMQLTGTQFTNTAALFGNDISTFPDFPAEIRAPQGTLAGVSGYQLHFGSTNIYTPGDKCDVLVVMLFESLSGAPPQEAVRNAEHHKIVGTEDTFGIDGLPSRNLFW